LKSATQQTMIAVLLFSTQKSLKQRNELPFLKYFAAQDIAELQPQTVLCLNRKHLNF
jgi:hypothetical protein